MAGPDLPAAGYVTNDLRTEAEVKAGLDDLIEVVRRVPGASPPEDLEISAGIVTPTGAGSLLNIETEGSVPADDLDVIAITNLVDGAEISIANTTGNTVTVQHEAGGSGQVSLQGDVDADLGPGVVIELVLDGTIWREKGRSWGDDPAPLRAYQGLGTAALADEGPGNGLDADTVDGLEASAFLLAAGTAANSSQLGGLTASGFIQTATASAQTMSSVLRTTGGRIIADAASAGLSSGFDHKITNVLRVANVFDDITDRWQVFVYAPDGTTPVAALRIDADFGTLEYDPDGSGTFYIVRHTGSFDYQPAVLYTLDSEFEITSPNVAMPVTGLEGISFPLTADGSKRFAIHAEMGVEQQNTGFVSTPSMTARMRIHVGASGDETDPVVFDSGVDSLSGTNGPILFHLSTPAGGVFVTPATGHVITVSVERVPINGTVLRRHVLTHDDLRRSNAISQVPGYTTTYLKIQKID